MPQMRTITARTKEMKKAGTPPVEKEVQFPSSLDEVKKGIGPWKNLRELFEDAYAHRVVMIQSKMRQALENGSEESEEGEDSLEFNE